MATILFELVSAGHSYAEVANQLTVGQRTVRPDVARGIAERGLNGPERYIHLQVDRLTRALRTADGRVERGDMKAVVAPLMKLIGALDRYHGLSGTCREPRLAPPPGIPAAPLALAAPAENFAKVSEQITQTLDRAKSQPKTNTA